jgi:hypothetical protein
MTWFMKISHRDIYVEPAYGPPRPQIDGRYGPFASKIEAKTFFLAIQDAELQLESEVMRANWRPGPRLDPLSVEYFQVQDPQEKIAEFDRAHTEWITKNEEDLEKEGRRKV